MAENVAARPAPAPDPGGPPRARLRARGMLAENEHWVMRLMVALTAAALLAAIALPLWQLVVRSLADNDGQFVGLGNYITYLTNPGLRASLVNSLYVSVISTALAVSAAFAFAYALTRTAMRGKGPAMALAMTPLFAPSLVYAIAFIYLFGNKGLITTGFFGLTERLLGVDMSFDIQLYGARGIVLAESVWLFPQVLLILVASLRLADARLYEAAAVLGASRWRTFRTVTLPSARYGLISALFVGFTLVFTDFGIPKVVGGSYNVLATDIYKRVIGQQDFAMGAAVSMLLLAPTVVAVVIYRLAERGQRATIGTGAVAYVPRPGRWSDRIAAGYTLGTGLLITGVLMAALMASLVNVWPYDLSLTLRHYDFDSVGGGGYGSFGNSVRMSLYTAAAGTAFVLVAAYVTEKGVGLPLVRRGIGALSLVPLALPGLVVGLMYIFFFNDPSWQLPIAGISIPNPLHFLYGTMALLVLSNVIHFYTVCFLTVTTALKALGPELEAVSASLGAPFYRTMVRVTAPLSLPALLDVGTFFFISAMTTVSAVIFLYPPHIKLASVAVVNMDDAGDTASAAAMSMLIVATSIAARAVHGVVARQLESRTGRWSRRST